MKSIINSKKTPKAIGPYSQAILCNNTLYTSGQLGIDPQTEELISQDISEQTQQTLENLKALLNEVEMEFSHILKTTIYCVDMADFNIINRIYENFFTEDDSYPARETVAVKSLPKNAKVEIAVIAMK